MASARDTGSDRMIDPEGVVDALAALVWMTDAEGQCDFANRQWGDYTGLHGERALGHGWQMALHPDDRKPLSERLGAMARSGIGQDIEARLRRADGEYRWFLLRPSPLANVQGDRRWCWLGLDADQPAIDPGRTLADGRMRRFLDMLPTQIVFMTPELEIEHVNRGALDYYGMSLDELKRWQESGAIHPDDIPATLGRFSRLLLDGEPYDGANRMRRADGSYRWVHARMVPSRDAQGNIVRYCSVQNDVDDLKRAEALLAREVRLLEMVALGRPLPDVLDALSRLVEEVCSDCACSILIVAPDRQHFRVGAGPSLPDAYNVILDGKTIDGGYGPCSLAILRKTPIITADLAHDPRWEGSTWLPLMQAYGYASCWSMPIMAASGEASGIFAIYRRAPVAPTAEEQQLIDRFTKIAEIAINRDQADEALRASEREMRRAYTQLAEGQRISRTGSFTSDLQVDQHQWSEEFYRIFEIDPAVRPGVQAIRQLIHPDDLSLFDEEMRQGTGGKPSDFNFRIVTASGMVKHLRGVARVVEYVNGRPIFVGTVQDITDARLAEEALNRARSELSHMARVTTLGALTASIAHEVNQPLAGIVANASACLRMLAADPPNVGGARATAHRTIRDGNRASEVVKRLRSLFARKERRFEPVNLNDAAREVLALSIAELRESEIMISTAFADHLPLIEGDRVQIQQVILNLLLNARDSMRGNDQHPRHLHLLTERNGDGWLHLSVRDNGTGFDEEQAVRLFDAFYTTKPEGMGVGLSVSRSIIESFGGRLWATANSDRGATFTFSLPSDDGSLAD